jgi:hypothetical protein
MRVVACLALAGLVATSISSAALAGEGCSGTSVVGHIFDKADTDRSGSLTPAEYGAAGLERFGVAFEGYDANADGEISAAEYLELYERHHAPGDPVDPVGT